ncbi:hypothetical protein EMIT0P201_11623 [Pseudomonas chlororaphis]
MTGPRKTVRTPPNFGVQSLPRLEHRLHMQHEGVGLSVSAVLCMDGCPPQNPPVNGSVGHFG